MSRQSILPSNCGEWETDVKASNPKALFDYHTSASSISFEQFLALRVLWKPSTQSRFSTPETRRRWLSDECYDNAKKLLDSDLSRAVGWHSYLHSQNLAGTTMLKQVAFPTLQTFSLVRLYQSLAQDVRETDISRQKFSPVRRTRAAIRAQKIPTTPTPTPRSLAPGLQNIDEGLQALALGEPHTPENIASPSAVGSSSASAPPSTGLTHASPVAKELAKYFPAAEDEAIVNTALLLFLNAIVMHFKEIDGTWSSHRKAFNVIDRAGNGFEARVDGYLRRTEKDDPMAILEVKPYIRSKKYEEIRMQEATQMAAWISSYPDFHDRYQAKLR